MENQVLETLEYKKVLAQLLPFASSSLGKEKVEQLSPSYDISVVQNRLAATEEGATVIRLKDNVPLGGIRDVRPFIQRAKLGSALSPNELLDVASTVASGRRMKQFLQKLVEDDEAGPLPILQQMADQISGLKPLQVAIELVVNEHGEVIDHASDQLRKIRGAIRNAEREIREKLEQIIKSSRYQPMVQEAIVTVRQDRYVVPVKQAYRSQFAGIVHDQSASGATVYIEPQPVVTLNHRLQDWRLKEEREIERLLLELSAKVAEAHDPLQTNVAVLAELDFIFAKAAYANHLKATLPKLNDRGVLRLKQARHPLIPADDVVPIDVFLGEQFTTLVVTGPNTGGKTVSLKTTGILTLMALSGLFIPAQEGSEVAVFEHVFADIGDEQSIEQSLSTFSGHMTNIVHILQQLSSNSLILLDELGAGTDPTEGAALAIALLDYIHQQGCRVVATTHYNELKAYAYNRDNVVNASVEFDVETLRPTYRLLIGVPGRSNAFAIAKRLGLPEYIVNNAKAQLSTDEQQVEGMIASLEAKRKQAEVDRETAASLRREVEQLREQVAEERDRLRKERERLRKQAADEARNIVRKAKREADQVIQQLRELSDRQTAIKEHRLIELKKKLDEQVPEDTSIEPIVRQSVNMSNLRPGDEVHVHSVDQKGHIIEILNEREVQVQLGIIKMIVSIDDVKPVASHRTRASEMRMTTFNRSKEHVPSELDLRGYNIEEAIDEIDKFFDDAVISGLQQVSLIHGKGTGVLRNGIHKYLQTNRYVKQFRLGGQGEGGSGVTVVQLN